MLMVKVQWMVRLTLLLASALLLRSTPAAAAELRELPFEEIALPKECSPRWVTSGGPRALWLVSEERDVCLFDGRAVRRIPTGPWGHEAQRGGLAYQIFEPLSLAGTADTLYLAGMWSTHESRVYTAFARIDTRGTVRIWRKGMDPRRRFTGPVDLGVVHMRSSHVEWLSGARTYVGTGPLVSVLLSPSRLWRATDRTIAAYDGWRWHYSALERDVIALAHDRQSTLWALAKEPYSSTEKRDESLRFLYRQEGDTWSLVATPTGFDAKRLHAAGATRLWAFGGGGLFLWDGTEVVQIRSPVTRVDDLCTSPDKVTYLLGTRPAARAAAQQGSAATRVVTEQVLLRLRGGGER